MFKEYINMSLLKLLKVAFFKTKKFNTKGEGVEFFNARPEITKKIEECDKKIEEFQENVIDEFDTFLGTYQKEMQLFILCNKEKRSTELKNKKELQKELLKREAIEDYLKEQKVEKSKGERELKREEFIKNNKMFCDKIKTFLEIPLNGMIGENVEEIRRRIDKKVNEIIDMYL